MIFRERESNIGFIMLETDALSSAATRKGKKPKGEWVPLSTIGKRGKTNDIKLSETDGVDTNLIVKKPKLAGAGSAHLGFYHGNVTSQILEDG